MHTCLFSNKQKFFFSKCSICFILFTFILNFIFPIPLVYSLENYSNFINLPDSGRMLEATVPYKPALIKGMTIHPENPLLFDFIVEPGDSNLSGSALNEEALRMVKYFLGSLTVPDKEMWVNLSPNEPDRIIPEGLGSTVLGRDLLSQDYILKQFTSSLMYPDKEVGKEFWERVYQKAYEQFGTTDIPLDSYNKVWVVPSKAAVYEEGNSVYIVKRVLKVMLEKDYLSMEKYESVKDSQSSQDTELEDSNKEKTIAEQVLREIIVPELEKEINEGRHFANLRQIYNAMILAKWYKETVKESLLGKVYDDQNKVEGINNDDPLIKEKIYDQYLAAFKKGVYNIIREEYDSVEETLIPRKYFSGGIWGLADVEIERIEDQEDFAMIAGTENTDKDVSVEVELVEVGEAADKNSVKKIGNHTILQKPFQSIVDLVGENRIRALLDRFNKAPYSMIDAGEEYMAPGLGAFAEFIASGGLGFLSGEFNAAAHEMRRMALASVSLAYKTRYNIATDNWEQIHYAEMPNVFPITVQIEGKEETIPFEFPVDFKGNYNDGGYGRRYNTKAYMVDNDGNPLFLLSVPDDPNIFHHLYDSFNQDEKRWIQYGLNARMLVEMIKNSGASPDIIRLNEGHMAFVYPAIRNDIEFHRKLGERSIFEGVKLIYTNHTPEYAGIPMTYDIDRLKKLVGEDLVPEYMLTDGHFNSLEAMAQIALSQNPQETGIEIVINGVSQEHYTVITDLLLKRFPDAKKVVTYVQNSSRAKDWFSDRIKKSIEEYGVEGITGEMLLEISEQDKADLNTGLLNLYGDHASSFYDELAKALPKYDFLQRWKKYQNTEAYLALAKWIIGEKDKIYTHPEILELSSLEHSERIEEVFLNPKWVDSPGLDSFISEAQEQKNMVENDVDRFIDEMDEAVSDAVPALKFIKNWEQYKETEAYKALVRWIVSDKDKIISHPEINEFYVLERAEGIEEIFTNPKWVESHGLDMLADVAKTNKGIISEAALNALVPQFDRKLLTKRPILAFLRRWVEYKEAGALLPLIKWIVGDKDKMYKHPELADLSVLESSEKLEKALKNPKWVEGPGLEMLMLAGGKAQGEPVGFRWLQEFKELSSLQNLDGRLVVIEDTGFPIMKLAAAGTTFLYNVPDPTREASGTSQQRWGFNGKPVIAIKGAGMSAQIKHEVSGWIVELFPKKSLKDLIEDFNPGDPQRIKVAREEFRKRVAVLDFAYIKDAARLYYDDREGLAKMMLAAFRYAYDTVRMERMVYEYEALGISLKNGQGIEGFHAIRRKMYLEDLLVSVYRWHPELKEEGASLQELRNYISEVWSPLDDLELGENQLMEIVSSKNTEAFLLSQGMEKSDQGVWFPTEKVFTMNYLDEMELDRAQQEDAALAVNAKTTVKSYGGINLDSQLLDLQVKRDGKGIPLPLLEQPIDQMKIDGFIPIIINVEPFAFPMKN